jgi:LemA protein
MLFWIGIGILAIVVLICIYYINRVIVLSNRVDTAWAQIDVQLKKRADLVPNLVETVKGYMKHERKAIELITQSREKMLSAKTVEEAEEASSMFTKALKTIFALAESYPKLRASENFKLLQEQLEGIESKIAYARQFYNDSVLQFNNMILTIPGVWFARVVKRAKTRPYFEAREEERVPVRVSFE